jgi:23S rRNA (guanine745-N1)-methyltransferase
VVLDEVLGALRCPVCGEALAPSDGAVGCVDGHSFDVARQGYVSLLAGGRASHRGDTGPMVDARLRFLAGGHFDALAEAVTAAVPAAVGLVVDLGAGPGWYLSELLDRRPDAFGVALDVSKPALRRAARAHARLAAVGCDVWGALPLRDGVAAVVLNVFAPRNAAEMARVLAPGGVVVVVTASTGHLAELRRPLGLLDVDDSKEERLAAQLDPHLRVVHRRALEWPLRLSHAAARDLAAMGPSAFHLDPAALDDRIARLPDPVEATAAVSLTVAAPVTR